MPEVRQTQLHLDLPANRVTLRPEKLLEVRVGNAFKGGDLVQLKSGGPPMTIQDWSNHQNKYQCVWFKGASRESGYFTEDSLKSYVAPQK